MKSTELCTQLILKLNIKTMGGNMTKGINSFHDNFHNIFIFDLIKLLHIGYTLF